MTVGLRDHVPELGRLPLLFRETFPDRDSVERNGATIVGTGTTFGPDGVTFDGNGNLLYNVSGPSILRAGYTIVFTVTFGSALDDDADHMFYDIIGTGGRQYLWKRSTNTLYWVAGGGLIAELAYATWSVAAVAGKNTFVVSVTSEANYLWLNGVLIKYAATAWSSIKAAQMTIGCGSGPAQRFVGTIHRFEIYGNVATAVDEPHLRQGTLISALTTRWPFCRARATTKTTPACS
ncbi:MAG: hypothetical protein WC683_18160 [bacterium]